MNRARWTLSWDPVRPLRGEGNRLLGLRWSDRVPSEPAPAPIRLARAWFGQVGRAVPGTLVPIEGRLAALDRRRRFLDALEAARRDIGRLVFIEPAARALLAEERERLERRSEGRRAARVLMGALGTLKRKLYPYQLDGVRRFFEEERLLLADDMGLGKTTQAVAACHALFETGARSREGSDRSREPEASVGAGMAGDHDVPIAVRRWEPRTSASVSTPRG